MQLQIIRDDKRFSKKKQDFLRAKIAFLTLRKEKVLIFRKRTVMTFRKATVLAFRRMIVVATLTILTIRWTVIPKRMLIMRNVQIKRRS